MKMRIGLATGFALGYYFGAKAGHRRYEQLHWLVTRAWESGTAGLAGDKARAAAELGAQRLWGLVQYRLADTSLGPLVGARTAGTWAAGPGPGTWGGSPWAARPGDWTSGPGDWTSGPGDWTSGPGDWTADPGRWNAGPRDRRASRGHWTPGHGRRMVGPPPPVRARSRWPAGSRYPAPANRRQASSR